MKIALCAANLVGYELVSYILKQKFEVEFAITCEGDKYENEIFKLLQKKDVKVHRRLDINGNEFKNLLNDNSIDIVFLLWWSKIVKKDIIDKAKVGFINLHPSLLPYNRGKHPYYWSIVENTPAGVSIHYITENIDDGNIICQADIDTDITTTGSDLYNKSIEKIIELFKNNYEKIIRQEITPRKQKVSDGTFHFSKELNKHSEIKLEEHYKAVDLINIIRARNFPNRPSSFFYLNGQKYYVNIEITKCEQ